MNKISVKVKPWTKKMLDGLKRMKKETYDEVISRLIESHQDQSCIKERMCKALMELCNILSTTAKTKKQKKAFLAYSTTFKAIAKGIKGGIA